MKRLTGILFLLLAGLGFSLHTLSSSPGYVSTPFEATPVLFDVVLFITLLLSMVIVTAGGLKARPRIVTVGCVGVVLWNAIFYTLPLAQGFLFATPGEDVMIHVGIIKTIISTGELIPNTTYNVAYSFFAIFTEVTGFHPKTIQVLVSFSSRSIFLLSIATLGRRYWGTQGFAFVFLAATPFTFARFSRTMHPYFITLLLIPAFLILYEKFLTSKLNKQRQIVLGVVVFLAAFPGLHPLVTSFLLITLIAYSLGWYLYDKPSPSPYSIGPVFCICLAGGLFVVWTIFNDVLLSLIGSVAESNIAPDTPQSSGGGGGGQSIISIYTAALSNSEVSFLRLLFDEFLMNYWLVLLYGMIGNLFTIAVAVKLKQGNINRPDAILSTTYLSGLAVAGLFIIMYVIAREPIRIGSVALLFSILIVGGVLVKLSSQEDPRLKTVSRGLLAIIILAGLASTGLVYGETTMMTDSNIEGVDWSVSHLDHESPTYSGLSRRMVFYTQGYNGVLETPLAFSSDQLYPRRLGYVENETIRQSTGPGSYIILTERDVNRHLAYSQYRWQSFDWMATSSDQRTLQNDETAHHVYDSEGYNIWLVTDHPVTETSDSEFTELLPPAS